MTAFSAPVVLRPVNLRWIGDAADDPDDFCAHGEVEFRIGEEALIEPTDNRVNALSAAALHLLRTLSKPHTPQLPVGEQLFPCCGHMVHEIAGAEDIVILGCPNGIDFEVRHRETDDGVMVRSSDGREWAVSWDDWRAAVFGFADTVSDFYAACSPKQVASDEADGYAKFVAEWERRRGKPFGRRV